MRFRSKRNLLITTALIATAVAWISGLVPAQVGGNLSSMVVSGISMEPNIHAGELVVLRQDGAAGVGDVAAYYNTEGKAVFLHRVVATQGEGFIFKGDNLAWRDPGVATRAQIKGVLWFQVPIVGTVIDWVQTPLHGAPVAAAVLLLANLLQRRRRRPAGTPQGARDTPPVSRPASHRGRPFRKAERRLAGTAALAAGIALLCVAGVAFTMRPGQASAAKVPPVYTHVVEFDYSAAVKRSAVYPDGVVTSADPMFPALIQRLSVHYVYRLESARPAAVRGTASLRLRLENSVAWQRSFVLQAPKEFTGTSVTVGGTVDLARLRRLMAQVDVLTGAPGSYTATVEAVVGVKGSLGGGGAVVDDPFRAEFPLNLTQPSGPAPAGLRTSADRPLRGDAPGVPAGIARRRPVAVGGAALFGAVALAAWLLMRRRIERYDEASRISIRYGRLLTQLAGPPFTGDREMQMASMEDLVSVARTHGCAIFHHGDALLGYEYLTHANGVVHRYSISSPAQERPHHPAM